MKAPKSIFNFNHIDPVLPDSETSEMKPLYQYYHKKYWLFKMTYKYFKKLELVCNIGSVSLVKTGIALSLPLNPIILGVVNGSAILLKSFSEAKNFKRKLEMPKFAYTIYEQILTDIGSKRAF